MALKLRFMIGLGMILTSSSIVPVAAKEISCRAVKKGAEHVAKIVMKDGKVESFFYGSKNKNGHTCEVIGSREKAGSTWVDEQGNKTLVSLFFSGEEIAKISLQDADPKFTIKILTPLTGVCGVSGYIAKTVEIMADKKACDLRD